MHRALAQISPDKVTGYPSHLALSEGFYEAQLPLGDRDGFQDPRGFYFCSQSSRLAGCRGSTTSSESNVKVVGRSLQPTSLPSLISSAEGDQNSPWQF